MSLPPLNPFANMNEEIEDVFLQLSGEQEPELPQIIENSHNQLLQNINTRVNHSLQMLGAMEGMINELTDESTEVNLTSPARLRLEKLNGILRKIKQEQDSLTSQLKTSAISLKTLQGHSKDLRKTAEALRVAVLKAPPKQSDLPANILMGGTFLSMTLAFKE